MPEPLDMAARPTGWRDEDETLFQSWYARASRETEIDPDPDAPEHAYNYRHAFKVGAWPDAQGHWPSAFKAASHPNRFVDGEDTATGERASDIAMEMRAEQDARLPQATAQARKTTPDRAAEVRRLADQWQLEPAVVERNFDKMAERDALAGLPKLQRESPVLASWLEDGDHASIAADDIEAMSAFEATVRRWSRDLPLMALRGFGQIPSSAVGLADMTATLMGAPGLSKALKDTTGYDAEADQAILAAFMSPETRRAQQNYDDAEDTLIRKATALLENPSVGVKAGVESLPLMFAGGAAARGLRLLRPGMSAAVAGAVGEGVTGAGSAMSSIVAQSEGGEATAGQAGLAAASGVGTTLFGLLGQRIAHAIGVADIDTLIAGAARSAGARRGLVRRIVYGATSEVLEEFGQGVQEQVMQNAALGRPLDEGLTDAMILGPFVAAVMGGGANIKGGPKTPTPKTDGTPEVPPTTLAIEELHAAALATKTFERAKPAFADFVQRVVAQNLPFVYAPTASFGEYFQGKGIDPAKMAVELTGDPEAWTTAQSTGDLAIPTGPYLSQITGSGHEAFFAQELRMKVGEENGRETTARMESAAAAVQGGETAQPVNAADAVDERITNATNEMTAQMLATGRVNAQEAEALSTLVGEAFPKFATRSGVDLGKIIDRFLPEIRTAEEAATTEADARQQQDLAAFDQTIAQQLAKPASTDVGAVSFPRIDDLTSGRLWGAANRQEPTRRTVRVDALVATQGTVSPEIVAQKNIAPGQEDVPLVLDYGGRLFIADGTHRATAARERGDDTIEVNIAIVDPVKLAAGQAHRTSLDLVFKARQWRIPSKAELDYLVAKAIKGGFTYDVPPGFEPVVGFTVSITGRTRIVPKDKLTFEDLAAYLIDNRDALIGTNRHLGAWLEGDDVWLDVTERYDSEDTAARLALARGERAYFDLAAGKVVRVDDTSDSASGGDIPGGLDQNLQAPDGQRPDAGGLGRGEADAGRGTAGAELSQTASTPNVKRPAPNAVTVAVAATYSASIGLPAPTYDYFPVDEDRARRIAAAYDALPVSDDTNPDVLAAYAAFAAEIQAQWDHVVGTGMVLEPWVSDDPTAQPYQSSVEMAEDVRVNRHLYFFTGGEIHHPIMWNKGEDGLSPNDKFRAVHDYFGHTAGGYGFGARGEESAWRSHKQMFTPPAAAAMTTETRGQNSWVNYGAQNYNEDGTPKQIGPKDKPYAVQKFAVLPPEFLQADIIEDPADPFAGGLDAAPAERKDGALLISTRRINPTKNTVFAEELLVTNLGLFTSLPPKMAQAAALFRDQTLVTQDMRRVSRTSEAYVRASIEAMKTNLRALWDAYPPEWRARAAQWYVGANRIANEMAEQYGLTADQVAGVLAALSPQQDWFRNASLAQRVLAVATEFNRTDPMFDAKLFSRFEKKTRASAAQWVRDNRRRGTTKGGKKWTPAMEAKYLKRQNKRIAEVRVFAGLRWNELPLEGKARFLRMHDEATLPRTFNIITPEGDQPGLVMTSGRKKSLPSKPAHVGWGTYSFIENALSIMEDGSVENIHERLGSEHKVRSFFNNISHPWDARSVTIDTHAVVAAYLQPLAGSSPEVTAVMGAKRDSKSAVPQHAPSGLSGTNAIVAQAYFEMAEEVGVLPREFQSVTWEAARSLFRPAQKRSALGKSIAAATKTTWARYVKGEITHATLVATILDAAGGFDAPAWTEHPVSEQGALATASVSPRRAGVSVAAGGDRGRAAGAAGTLADLDGGSGVLLGPVGRKARTFYQDAATGPTGAVRGSIKFRKDSTPLIKLFKAKNRTTLFHEAGHLFLEMFTALSSEVAGIASPERTEMQQELLGDMDTLREWLADEDHAGPGFSRKSHEKFARGLEAFIMEGKAPSLKLRAMFGRVASWMRRIYRNHKGLEFAAGQSLTLTPEVRAVFQRMLASDAAIAEAEADQGVQGLFSTAEDAGMDESSFNAYRAIVQGAADARRNVLDARQMQELARDEQAWWRAERAAVVEQVTAQVHEEPVYRALAALRRGTQPDGRPLTPGAPVVPMKLSKASLVAEFGPSVLAKLPRPYVYATDGVEADVLGPMVGFPDGAAMIGALLKAQPMAQAISDRADAIMRDRHGDISHNIEQLKAAALEAMAHVSRDGVIRAELAIMRKLHKAGKALSADAKMQGRMAEARVRAVLPDAETLQRAAEAQVGRMKLQTVSPERFMAAVKRSSMAATAAAARGDIDAAVLAKQDEATNLALFRAATALRQHVVQSRATFAKMFDKPDKGLAVRRQMDYVHAARAIAATYFWPERRRVRAQEALQLVATYDPALYANLAPQMANVFAQGTELRSMTGDAFAAMAETVTALWDQSLRSQQQMLGAKKVDRDLAAGEVVVALDKVGPRAGPRGKMLTYVLGARALFTRVEHWITSMDANDPDGVMRRYIFTPVAEAVGNYRVAKLDTITKFLALLEPIKATLVPGKIIGKELQFESKAALLHAVAHSGNKSNFDKLLRGFKWTEEQWRAFMAEAMTTGIITKADMDFVQGLWNLNESLKPAAQRAHRDVYGRYFSEITSWPVETPWGTYPGGYMPAVLDPFASADGTKRAANPLLDSVPRSMFPEPGFAQSRVDAYAQPLALNLALVPGHLDQVLRFTHLQPAVVDVQRLLNTHAVRDRLHEHDPQALSAMLTPWLERTLSQKVERPSWPGWHGIDAFFRGLRSNSGLAIMSGHIVNVMQQLTGVLPALIKVKPRYMKNALRRMMTERPSDISDEINDASKFMRTTGSGQVAEMLRQIDDVLLNPGKFMALKQAAHQHGYFMQIFTQNIVSRLTWMAAYEQAMERADDHDAAVLEADSTVREAQGSGAAEDISAFEVQPAIGRVFTMFFGWANMMANLNGYQQATNFREAGLRAGAGRALYLWFFGFASVSVVSELIRQSMGGFDDDDDDTHMDEVMWLFFGSQARLAASFVPWGVASAAYNLYATNTTYDDRVMSSPAVQNLEALLRAGPEVYDAMMNDGSKRRAVRDALTAITMLTGVPVAALNRPAGYAVGMMEGTEEPEDMVDMARGLLTGRSQER